MGLRRERYRNKWYSMIQRNVVCFFINTTYIVRNVLPTYFVHRRNASAGDASLLVQKWRWRSECIVAYRFSENGEGNVQVVYRDSLQFGGRIEDISPTDASSLSQRRQLDFPPANAPGRIFANSSCDTNCSYGKCYYYCNRFVIREESFK